MTRYALAAVACSLAAAPAVAQAPASTTGLEPGEAVRLITEETYVARVGALAHDSMRGRRTPSPEIDATAAWIAAAFRRFGLAPTAADGFIQWFPIERVQFDVVRSEGVIRGPEAARLVMGKDFLVAPFRRPRLGALEGELLFVDGGPRGIGDENDPLAGRDLTGTIVVQYSQDTGPGARVAALRGWKERGVVAVLWVTRASSEAFGMWVQRWNRPAEQVGGLEGEPPIIAVRAASVEAAFRAAGANLEALADAAKAGAVVRPLPGLAARFVLEQRATQRSRGPNVAGILRGSDPALRDEYVVFSAHIDHVGVGRPVNGDSIYNGADDDASGTAAVISLAEAFAALGEAPRRSIIFLGVSAEERGLWGSRYFAEHPPVPIAQVVANLNIDMIGRNWRDTIVAIGREQSSLGATLERVNAAHPELGMRVIDDPWPDERFYFRSDHFNFARQGVPILFFFSGVHNDYHRPSDHVEKIDGEKATRITRLLFWLGLEVANAAQRPTWDEKAYEEVVGR